MRVMQVLDLHMLDTLMHYFVARTHDGYVPNNRLSLVSWYESVMIRRTIRLRVVEDEYC